MNVTLQPDKGCERFLCLQVAETSRRLPDDRYSLDRAARRLLASSSPYHAREGRLAVAWKSDEDRQRCMRDQSARGRWSRVEELAQSIDAGVALPPPVFLSPALTQTSTFRLADGARRIMAAAEKGIAELPCVILCPDAGFSSSQHPTSGSTE